MRTIKFRAWAAYSKVMFYPDSDDGWELSSGVVNPLPNTILMQFTGLLDKNGKEIYEGDVVRVLDDIGGEITCGEKYDEYTVKIQDHSFMQFLEDMCGEKQTEIIGNVYENPDLLAENLPTITKEV